MNNDIPSYNFDLINKKLAELDALKEKVEKIYGLSQIGDDVRREVDEYKVLRDKGVNIPHLEKEFADQIYPSRGGRSKKNKPIVESEIKEALEKSTSARKAAKRLGVSYQTFKTYAKKYGVHKTPGWPPTKKNFVNRVLVDPNKGKYPIQDVLDGKYPNFPVHRLKDKLVRSNIKKAECEQCGFHERRITDGKLPLLVNFEDGNKHNHALVNLKLLCYNCTFTSGKGYISRGPKILDPDILQDSKKILKQRF